MWLRGQCAPDFGRMIYGVVHIFSSLVLLYKVVKCRYLAWYPLPIRFSSKAFGVSVPATNSLLTPPTRSRQDSSSSYLFIKGCHTQPNIETSWMPETNNCLVLSVSAVWTQLQTRQQDSFQFQVISNPRHIWDWTGANWKLGRDETKLSCLVANCVHTSDTDKTRQEQFCLVRVGGVNKL